jgi:hypothetical protein
MPVNSFKFVSPGVFINEIDNSFTPQQADAIGPVVIGRSSRGLAMQPVTVQSYSEFVELFGDTVPGFAGGDVYRHGNYQSPMYGTYAAKAFLNANVAPLTYIRLLGQETSTGNAAGGDAAAGWKTDNIDLSNGATAGGAYGLFVAPSSSFDPASPTIAEYTGSNSFQLAAIIYVQSGSVKLKGNLAGPENEANVIGSSTIINSDSDGNFQIIIDGDVNGEKTFTVNFDDGDENFIRKQMKTNPQLASTQGLFFPSSSHEDYWLGETFEQEILDLNLSGQRVGIIAGLMSGSSNDGPANMKKVPSQEAIAGWFIGQDTGIASSYNPATAQKLFRLIGRGHGEWLHKNCKVSIENIRQSTTTVSPYGSFSVVIRSINDTDATPEELERYDNCNLDPSSPNYIARLIGDIEYRWDDVNNELKEYGTYPNLSRYVRVEVEESIDSAGGGALLPFGYYGPPRFKEVTALEATGSSQVEASGDITNRFLVLGTGLPGYTDTTGEPGIGRVISSSYAQCTASFSFPSVRIRSSSLDNKLTPKKAYFGLSTYRTSDATGPSQGIGDFHRLLYAGLGTSAGVPTDPTISGWAVEGIEGYSYIFTMDNISGSSPYVYNSGSRTAGTSYTAVNGYESLLNNKINKFTAPFWGGFDGFDITKPDPVRNLEMSDSSTEDDSYVYHTYTRAIQTVADPEYINMNLLAVPGLTNTALTSLMIDTCAERSDAMALIDLPDVYIPPHEEYKPDRTSRIGTTPVQAANSLKSRRIDSSYGATFYPWVQTVDANTSQIVWIPPTVAMMGVLASSEKASEIWFAPAGFNRGGLSNDAAGIPISAVSERLSSGDRDTLYESRINPIASFPSEGIVVFGQKTLQERPSALDRINVRRLVIFLKKQISILSTQVLFEQNVPATWRNFKALVDPFLSSVQTRLGITDYRLILDSSTTTPDLIDRNILYAKIMVKPARAIEYIAIDFVVASSGASFDD